MTTSLCQRVLELCDRVLATSGPTAGEAVTAVRDALDQPLRVAIAGRVSSGKSTLVNALLQRRVAPVEAGECTTVVTSFRYGVPERFQIRTDDGKVESRALQPDGSLPDSVGISPEKIRGIDVYLPNQVLQDLIIIDTPGLSSIHDETSQRTEKVLRMSDHSRAAADRADALIFLMTQDPHEDDVAALSGFRGLFGPVRSTTINAIGVLAKADRIEGGWPGAIAKASRQAEALRGYVSAVVPVSGLLAETAETGIKDQHARAIEALAGMNPDELDTLMLDAEIFDTDPAPISQSVRAELRRLFDFTGIREAVDLANQRVLGAPALERHLRDVSGVEHLRAILKHRFGQQADLLKADRAMLALEEQSHDHTELRWVRDEVEFLRMDPAMQRLDEARSYLAVQSGQVSVPEPLLKSLEKLVGAERSSCRLGLPADASNAAIKTAAIESVMAWRTYRNSGLASLPGERVADVLIRSYELLWQNANTLEGSCS